MIKIKSFDDLQKIKAKVINDSGEANNPNSLIKIKVGMATCGIASGAGEIMQVLVEECERQAIDVTIKQTGCLGYCYAEPMVEVQIPGAEPVVFGYVDKNRALEIIDKFILQRKQIEGVIPVSFKTINELN